MAAPALDIGELSLWYKGREAPALSGIHLRLDQGETLVVTGPAASGKTSFCLCLKGLIPQAREGKVSGRIHVLGKDVSQFRTQTLSREVGLVLQDPEVQIVGRTVAEDLAFGPRNFLVPAGEIRARIPKVLAQVGLAGYEDRATMDLSGGEKQRLAIAGALAAGPDLLILDEPASELDPRGRRRLYTLLKQLKQEQGLTLVIVESRPVDLAGLADQVLVLDQGRATHCGPPDPETFRHRLPAVPMASAPPAPMAPPILEIRGLEFAYTPDRPVLRGVDLSLEQGGFTALMGHNGAGKTSLLKHLNGLIPLQTGSITIAGRRITDYAGKELTRTVGFVFQNPDHQIFESSVEKEISFGLTHRNLDRKTIDQKVEEALEWTGLTHHRHRHPHTLAKGMRQRIAVAAIIALEPELLVVDEPTTGLDPQGSREIMELIQGINARGTAVLFITHDLNLACRYARRLALMDQGRLLLEAPMDRALENTDLLERAGILPGDGRGETP